MTQCCLQVSRLLPLASAHLECQAFGYFLSRRTPPPWTPGGRKVGGWVWGRAPWGGGPVPGSWVWVPGTSRHEAAVLILILEKCLQTARFLPPLSRLGGWANPSLDGLKKKPGPNARDFQSSGAVACLCRHPSPSE